MENAKISSNGAASRNVAGSGTEDPGPGAICPGVNAKFVIVNEGSRNLLMEPPTIPKPIVYVPLASGPER